MQQWYRFALLLIISAWRNLAFKMYQCANFATIGRSVITYSHKVVTPSSQFSSEFNLQLLNYVLFLFSYFFKLLFWKMLHYLWNEIQIIIMVNDTTLSTKLYRSFVRSQQNYTETLKYIVQIQRINVIETMQK